MRIPGGLMISFQCSSCRTSHQAPDEKSGTKCYCPECGLVITVPATSTTHAPPVVPAASSQQQGCYYIKEKRKVGPVSWAELQQLVASGQLTALDMVLP